MSYILNIVIPSHPCDHEIASKDGGTYDLSGTKIMTVHLEHRHDHIHVIMTYRSS